MEDEQEKIFNYIYAQLTENYALKGVCLEILKDLEQKKILNDKERYWQREIASVLFESEGI
ncbi:MAG: hypothetical protein ACI8ZM_005007 [Crocinitomix sp.]|jgi:hypothetical protein